MRAWLSVPLMLLRSVLPAQPDQLRFQHLTTDDGLSDNAITCVYEDRAGYIWIGTESGLDRYDGQTIWPVEGAHEHITAITEDRQGTYWVATKDQGLLRLEPGTWTARSFRHVPDDPGTIASDQITALYDLNDTTLLIGSRQVSLIFCDKRTFKFTYWTDSLSLSPARASARPSPLSGWCHAIVPLDERLLWVGFLNFHETLLADRGSGEVLHRLQVVRAGSESQTTALLLNGTLYNGGWQSGVDVIRMADRPLERRWITAPDVIDMPDETLAMVPWRDGRIIAGTRAAGLLIIDPGTGHGTRLTRSRYDPASLLSDRIRCLLVDRHGTLWVGTADGLSRHVPGVWSATVHNLYPESVAAPPDLFFHRIEQMADGRVRIYTSEGFFIADSALRTIEREAVTHNGMSLQPTVMGQAQDGTQLLGTEYGIVGYDPISGMNERAFEPNDGQGNAYRVGTMFQVRGLWPDRIGGRPVMVIGAMGFGVTVVDAHTGLTLGNGMPAAAATVNTRNLVNDIVRTRDGTYWIASADGLFHWRADEPMAPLASLAGGRVNNDSIFAAGEDVRQILLLGDTVWAVTHAGSLLAVVKGGLKRYDPTPSMSNPMLGLTDDRRGRLWITTDDGLLRFDRRTFEFLHVPVNDGHGFRKLTRAITTLDDGRIALCASNALIVLDPQAYDGRPQLPDPYLTSVSAAGRPLPVVDGRVRLSYRASVIDLGISALAQGYPQPLVFEYRLNGVETEWRSIGAREPIRYAGVPTGTHDLLVRVRDPFGRLGPPTALLTVEVTGPIWQQWWFFILALLIVSIGLYAFYNYRLVQAVKLQAVRNRIARDLHDDIGSTLGSISYYSAAVKQRIAQQDAAGAQEVLDRIGEGSREMIDQMHDIVWSVDPRKDAFGELSARMRSFASGMLGPLDVGVRMEEDPALAQVKLSMEQRKGLFLIFKEAVYNAAKHARAGNLVVTLLKDRRDLSITIVDDGIGPMASNGSAMGGNGLDNMRKRAQDLGGSCEVVAGAGGGTEVRVRVPLHAPLPANGD